jgi:hypothetical protein
MYLLGEVRSFWRQGGNELVLGLPASSTQRWMSSLAYSVRSSLVCLFLSVSGTTEAASALWEAWSPTWRLLCCRSLSSFPCLFSRISGLGCLRRIDYLGRIPTIVIVLVFNFNHHYYWQFLFFLFKYPRFTLPSSWQGQRAGLLRIV